jgi:hypothetical protein
MCLSSANSSLSAGSSERVTVETSSWTVAEICSVSDQWAATADSTNCTTFAGWTALFTTISHQHGEWCHWLPTWLLSSVSARACICPSTKLTTCLCQPRLRMGVGSFVCLCDMVPTHRMYPQTRHYHRAFIICILLLVIIVCSLAVHYTCGKAHIKIPVRYVRGFKQMCPLWVSGFRKWILWISNSLVETGFYYFMLWFYYWKMKRSHSCQHLAFTVVCT